MLKPKTHTYKLKINLNKLQAVNNKVASRCHASLKIQNQQIAFKLSPQLKKNVAIFNCEAQYEHFSIYFDQITALYENKSILLQFQIETQGTKVKIGQVQINLGSILNQKKFRIVNTFPLTKCYDKTAKAKLSVDFIPLSAPAEQITIKEKKTFTIRQNLQSESQKNPLLRSPSGGNLWKQSNYKSRLAEQSNHILQQKIYEYQQKMDNYRLSQTQMQQKLHEQVSNKDDHISELTIELNRRNQQLSAVNIENQQLKFRVKELNEEILNSKQTNRSLMIMIQNLQHEEEDIKKESMSLKVSLENQGKTKENKEKYFTQQLAKYTQRYLESQQERNKIVFELQSKFREEIQKKQSNYRLLMASNDKKHSDSIINLKQRIKKLQSDLSDKEDKIEKDNLQIKKYADLLNQKTRDLNDFNKKLDEVNQEKQAVLKNYNHQSHELETLNFSYMQQEREINQLRDQLNTSKKNSEQLRMELMMANQTIQQQRKSLTKITKELQVHQQREYYLTQKYNDEMEMKSVHEENIRGESLYYRDEFYKIKNRLRITEERAQEESHKNHQIREILHRMEQQLTNKNQSMIRLGQEKIILETENRNLKNELSEMQQALLQLKEQNMQLNQYLRDKKNSMDNDKSLEWSYRIEQLQSDISEMVEKFKIEKDLLRDGFRKQQGKRKQQISNLSYLLKKEKDDNQQLRRIIARKDAQYKEYDDNKDHIRLDLKEKSKELNDCREKIRIYIVQIEQLQNRSKQIQERQGRKLKQVQERHQKQIKSFKKAQTLKNSFTKTISILLEYLTRPLTTSLAYQQIISPDIDPQISNMINFSLKKHCDQRSKLKQTIKRYQSQSYLAKPEQKNSLNDFSSKYQQKGKSSQIINESTIKRSYLKESQINSNWKYQQNQRSNILSKDNLQLDTLRQQNTKLKRQLSQLRVKLKNCEDDVVKAQRNADSEHYSKQAMNRQMEQLQDQLQKVSFQLKRKEKIIIQYQSEMKDLQTEVLSVKNLQAVTTPKNMLSRFEIKAREKEQSSQNSRNGIIIRDLQGKLQQVLKENQQQIDQNNRLNGQISNLNETINNLKNQLKISQTKIKEKNAKIAYGEDQLVKLQQQLKSQYQKQNLKKNKLIVDLQENVTALQVDNKKYQQSIQNLQKTISDYQKKLKLGKEESRSSEMKWKRQYDQLQSKLKDSIQNHQHSILRLQSQLQQQSLKSKQHNNKIASLNSSIAKRNEQLQKYLSIVNAKNSEIAHLQQQISDNKVSSESKISNLQQKIEQLESRLVDKDYQLQEYKFTSQGKLMDLQKRLQDAMLVYTRK